MCLNADTITSETIFKKWLEKLEDNFINNLGD